MATAGDLVKRSLRLISQLTQGETLSAEDGEQGLIALNDLVHSWYADNVLVPFITREELTLTSGKSEYTIGDGAELDTDRPMSIASIIIRDGDRDFWLREISQRWWSQIPVKLETQRPDRFYYEEGWPNGTLRFDTEPDQNYTMFITSYKPFSDLSSLASTIVLPPMYEKALAFNLGIDLAPEYGIEAPQAVLMEAQWSKNAIVQRNLANRPVEMGMDYSLTNGGRSYDIRSDS